MSQINLNINQIINILNRFQNKFTYTKNPHKKKTIILFKNTVIINIYKKKCLYSKDFNSNFYKDHLIIKYKNENEDTIMCLNILFDDYKDLFE
jgi:hypothetical protein